MNAENGTDYWKKDVAGTKDDPFKSIAGVMNYLANFTEKVKTKEIIASQPFVIVNLDGNETHNFINENATFLIQPGLSNNKLCANFGYGGKFDKINAAEIQANFII